ncbi:hypothetical protein [Rhodococcus sp. SJ-2]
MSVDPTTAEGRVAIGTWAKLGHDIPGHKVLALLDALDQAQGQATEARIVAKLTIAEVDRNLIRAAKAESALERVREDLADAQARLGHIRDYAEGLRDMGVQLAQMGRRYDALPYDNTAAALERIIGGEQ